MITKSMEPHELELMDFSDEILFELFSNFNDIDLLNAAQVCRRFKSIAKETFAKKYNGNTDDAYFEIDINSDDTANDQRLFRILLTIFGNEIKAMNLNADHRANQHKLLKVISQQCRSIRYMIISNNRHEFNVTNTINSMNNLTSLTLKDMICTNFYWADKRFPHLSSFCVENVRTIDMEVIKLFIYINPQLNELRVINCRKFPLKAIQALRDRLKRLKKLEYVAEKNEFSNRCRDINMIQLESLKISVDSLSFQNVIGAFARGSKMIQKLDVQQCESDNNNDGVYKQIEDTIPLFSNLTDLRLERFDVPFEVIRSLVLFLTKLTHLKLDGVKLNEFSPNEILFIYKKCKQLKELLLSSNENLMETNNFNSEFHQKFVSIVKQRNEDCKVKFELKQPETDMMINNEKITKNNDLIYWTGCETCENSSKITHLFDIGEKCLNKIFFYLDEKSERAIYETCSRFRDAMQDRIRAQVFTVTNEKTAKDTFNRFGEHITKLKIDIETRNYNDATATWKCIGNQSQNIIELSIFKIKVNAVDSIKVTFPKMKTLKIMSVVSSRTHIFPQIECPNLCHLEFHSGEIKITGKPSHLGIIANRMEHIRLNHYSDAIGKVLHSLHGNICDRVQKLTVERCIGTGYDQRKLVNIAMRFRNLITLDFIQIDLECTHIRYLFQTCTKLVYLTIGVDNYFCTDEWKRMLQLIKTNCCDLQVIRLAKTYNSFDENLLILISKTLPNVKLFTTSYDPDNNFYTMQAFKRLTKADREKPY